jgi:uncharacterized protein
MSRSKTRIIGVISDTHGLLRSEACAALKGVDHIIHAGDIGAPSILTALSEIAPVTAIRGNNDRDDWARSLPETTTLVIDSSSVHIIHNIGDLDKTLPAHLNVIVSGHSHKPSIAETDGVLYLNPGSAGPRRFSLPITVAKLFIRSNTLRAEIIPLTVKAGAQRKAASQQRH